MSEKAFVRGDLFSGDGILHVFIPRRGWCHVAMMVDTGDGFPAHQPSEKLRGQIRHTLNCERVYGLEPPTGDPQ